jgi:serine protease Do
MSMSLSVNVGREVAMSKLIQQLNDEMADVVEQTKSTLVHISNGGQSHGAGIIVSSDGLILTNAHVVRQHSLEVTLPDGRIIPARLAAHDTDRDLALLKIEANNLPAMSISDAADPQPGQWVTAVGHPWGVAGAVTSGILIDNGDRMPAPGEVRRGWLAASLHLRPGNSGGPLVDVSGRLLGVNTVMAGPEVGLAIPAEVIRSFLDEVKALENSQTLKHNEESEPPVIV